MHLRTTGLLLFMLEQVVSATPLIPPKCAIFGKDDNTRKALLIGNSNYDHHDRLPNAVNDVDLVESRLVDVKFSGLKCKDLKYTEMVTAIDTFLAKRPDATSWLTDRDDVVLFYYAGHGSEIKGANFIYGTDIAADYSGVENEVRYNKLSVVLNYMTALGQKVLSVIIIDACRTNPKRGVNQSASFAQQPLKQEFAPKGMYIAFSTSAGQTASDGEVPRDGVGHSPFADVFADEVMRSPRVDIDILFRRIRLRVIRRTNGSQKPYSNHDMGVNFDLDKGVQAIELPEDK